MSDQSKWQAADCARTEEEARNLRAERADHDADQRDTDAEHAASASAERDREAAARDQAAAHRQTELLADALQEDRGRRVDDVPMDALTRQDEWEQVEIDHEVCRSFLAEAATLDFDQLLEQLGLYVARWQAVRRELRHLSEDRAADVEDRRHTAEERAAADHARANGAADRIRGAADRDQRQIEAEQLPPVVLWQEVEHRNPN